MRLTTLLGLGMICGLGLSACGNGLRTVGPSGDGPDEFMIMPVSPLTQPKNYTDLPAPTPGGTNLTDRNPTNEAVIALGGRPSTGTQIPSSDAALIAQVNRYGAPGNARAEISAADAAYLERQGRLSGLRLVDRYNAAYRSEWLDQRAEAERLRALGVDVSPLDPVSQ